jgi:hypothetical protein
MAVLDVESATLPLNDPLEDGASVRAQLSRLMAASSRERLRPRGAAEHAPSWTPREEAWLRLAATGWANERNPAAIERWAAWGAMVRTGEPENWLPNGDMVGAIG